MNVLKLRKNLLLIVTISLLGVAITSCEKEIKQDILTQNQDDQNESAFKQLVVKTNDNYHYKLNEVILQDLIQQEPNDLQINIPLADKVLELKLVKWEDNETQEVDVLSKSEFGLFYHGELKNDENSIVSFSIFKKEINLMIISDEIYHLNKQKDGDHVLVKVAEKEFETGCHSDFFKSMLNAKAKSQAFKNCANPRAVRVKYLVDETFQDFFNGPNASYTNLNSISSAPGNYIRHKFHSVRTIYLNAGLRIRFVGLIHDSGQLNISGGNPFASALNDLSSDSNYAVGSNSYDVLGGIIKSTFGGGWGNYGNDGDAPICHRGFNHGYTPPNVPHHIAGLHTNSGVPDDNYFIFVLAHELGHNYGIPHTGLPGLMSGTTYDDYISSNVATTMHNSWTNCYCP